MLLFLFGLPGAGKNYVGHILKNNFNFYFYDADEDLTEDMRQAIHNKELYTNEMRDIFFKKVISQIKNLQKKYDKIVVTQTLAKERNRHQLLHDIPNCQFILIEANASIIRERLIHRSDWVSLEYAEKVNHAFEKPVVTHDVIENNGGAEEIINQLKPYFLKCAS